MAVIQRRGHQVRRLVAGVTEHDALVARALVLVAAGVHALRDVRRLAVQIILEPELLPVKAALLVADVAHGLANRRLDLGLDAGRPLAGGIHDVLAADFARQHDELRRGQRLAGDPRLRVLRQEQVDDGVADLIGNLVGMALGHGFGGEEEAGAHEGSGC